MVKSYFHLKKGERRLVMSRTAELIKKFCEERSDRYLFCENYERCGHEGKETCIGVIINDDTGHMVATMELTEYLDDYVDELDPDAFEAYAPEYYGEKIIIYFPYCQG